MSQAQDQDLHTTDKLLSNSLLDSKIKQILIFVELFLELKG